MTISTVTLNNQPLAPLAGYSKKSEYIGSSTTLGNGKIRRDLVQSGSKWRFTLSWTRLTEEDLEDLQDAYDAAVSAEVAFTGPDGTTAQVMAGPQPGVNFEGYRSGSQLLYRGSIELWEV